MKTAYTAIFALIVMLGGMSHAQEPVKLHPDSGEDKAQLEKDVAQLDAGILRAAEALNHAAGVLAREHNYIWSLPDDRLLALLNANVQRSIAIAQAKDKAAAEINSLLNQLNIARFTNRAPIGFGRADVSFNQETQLFEIEPVDQPVPPSE